MKQVKNYYVLSHRFNGQGSGFAIGFNRRAMAVLFACFALLGFAQVLSDFELELRFPAFYHHLVSFTA